MTLLEENFAGRYKSYQIDHLNSGRLLYILLDGDEPSQQIDFRDFVAGTRYRVKVVQSVSGLDSDVTSTFYLVLSIDESEGTKNFTVGSPNYSRKHVHNYVVRQVILAPNGRALVFLIERNEYDSDGTRSDIGANPYITEQLLGDCNADNEQNVVDIIFNINNCIIENSEVVDCSCSDLNNDNDYNVLDVVMLVNIILYD